MSILENNNFKFSEKPFIKDNKKQKICLSGYNSSERQVLFSLVESFGGEPTNDLTKKTFILISKKSNTKKVEVIIK